MKNPIEGILKYALENDSSEEILVLLRKYPFLVIEFYRYFYMKTGKNLLEMNGFK